MVTEIKNWCMQVDRYLGCCGTKTAARWKAYWSISRTVKCATPCRSTIWTVPITASAMPVPLPTAAFCHLCWPPSPSSCAVSDSSLFFISILLLVFFFTIRHFHSTMKITPLIVVFIHQFTCYSSLSLFAILYFSHLFEISILNRQQS